MFLHCCGTVSWVTGTATGVQQCHPSVVVAVSSCLQALKRIQNIAAHIVTYHRPKCPTSPHDFNLHWHRINFKAATLTYKTLATGQPGYLLNLLNAYQPVRSLHSQDNHLLAKPSVYTSIDRRTFSYAAPQIWNAISPNICISPLISSFKHSLKTYYFAAAAFIRAMCHQ